MTPRKWRRAAIALLPLLLAMLLCVTSAEALVVTFDSCGGSGVTPYTDVPVNTRIAPPASPLRNDATFLGWFRDPEWRIPWNFSNDIVTEDLTLYAGWQNIYLVRVRNGYPASMYVAAGERVYIHAHPADFWERFYRWVSLAGSVRFANRYAMQTSFIMPAQNVTVEARYRDDWYDALGVGGGCATGVGGIALLVVAYLLTRQK